MVGGLSHSVGGGVGAQAGCQKDVTEEKKKKGGDRSLGEKDLAEGRREAQHSWLLIEFFTQHFHSCFAEMNEELISGTHPLGHTYTHTYSLPAQVT